MGHHGVMALSSGLSSYLRSFPLLKNLSSQGDIVGATHEKHYHIGAMAP
jgi:hypothetical protein